MDNPGIFDLGSRNPITTALSSVVLTSASDLQGVTQGYIDGLADIGSATFFAEFIYGSGGSTAILLIQTSINQGSDWIDIARFDFATANRQAVATVSGASPADPATVTALAAEGVQNGVLGDRIRAVLATTGTYAGNTSIEVKMMARGAGAAFRVMADHSTTGLGHGKKTVTTAGSDVVLAASTPAKWVTIQAYAANTGKIAVGGSGVDATAANGDGVSLAPDASITLPVNNLADVFIDATVNGEGVRFTYGT